MYSEKRNLIVVNCFKFELVCLLTRLFEIRYLLPIFSTFLESLSLISDHRPITVQKIRPLVTFSQLSWSLSMHDCATNNFNPYVWVYHASIQVEKDSRLALVVMRQPHCAVFFPFLINPIFSMGSGSQLVSQR